VQIFGTVSSGATEIVNTASVEGQQDNQQSSAGVPLVAAPDLRLTKTANVTYARAGDLIVYTLQATNIGNEAAVGVEIRETVPTGTTFVAASSTGVWSCADGSGGGTSCVMTLGSTVPATVRFAVRANNPLPSTIRSFVNIARIVDNNGGATEDPQGNNTAQVTTRRS
jgi:uncharacterized repeat protein (TIGR01451 family)